MSEQPYFEKPYRKARAHLIAAYREMEPLLDMQEDVDLTGVVVLKSEFRHLRDALREYMADQFGYGVSAGGTERRP
jgi:hypothetical protein